MSDDEEVKRADNSNSKDNSASFNNDLFLSDEDAMVGNEFTGKFLIILFIFRPTKEVSLGFWNQKCIQSKSDKRR
jgi:hypothetical protein